MDVAGEYRKIGIYGYLLMGRLYEDEEGKGYSRGVGI
jgi:hypothetical protein